MAICAASSRFANVLRELGVGRGERVFALAGRIPELYIAALGTLEERQRVLPAVLGLRTGADPRSGSRSARRGCSSRPSGSTGKKIAPLRDELPALEHVLLAGRRRAAARARVSLDAPHGGRQRHVRDPGHGPRGHGAAAFHERHDRHAEGRRARARGRRRAPRDRLDTRSTCTRTTSSGARPIPGWVTGTSYGIIAPLTHGVTMHRRRGRVRRRALVLDPRGASGHRLVHGADGDPHADAAPAPSRVSELRPLARCASSPASASRSTRRRCVWGARGARPADPRQLVADRDRRDHDRQLRRDGHPPGLDGPAAAGHRGGDPRATTTATVLRDGEPVGSTTPSVEGELALRPGWPSMFRGYLHEDERYALLRRRLVPAPATWRAATPTATSGSSAAPTTSSSRPAT